MTQDPQPSQDHNLKNLKTTAVSCKEWEEPTILPPVDLLFVAGRRVEFWTPKSQMDSSGIDLLRTVVRRQTLTQLATSM
jgi:hypothetical protein